MVKRKNDVAFKKEVSHVEAGHSVYEVWRHFNGT